MSDEFRDGFPFVGGRLWLDFLNTTPLDPQGRRIEMIDDDGGLARWARAADLAGAAFEVRDAEDARRFREDLRNAFGRLAEGEPIGGDLIDEINRRLARVERRAVLVGRPGGPTLEEERRASDVTGLVADDVARFVCDHAPERLKHCANPGCSMVFYDTGKNNRRRWCTMSVCGNRDKVSRFRDRRRHGDDPRP